MISRLLVSVAIAIGFLVVIALTTSRFVLPDGSKFNGWVPPDNSALAPERAPIQLSIESDRSVTPVRLRGRFLAAFETWHFQPEGSDKWLWVDDKTGSLNDLYQKLVAEPRRRAAIYGWKPGTILRDHLCLSVELTGQVEHELGAVFDRFVVDKVRSAEVLEINEYHCLHLKAPA